MINAITKELRATKEYESAKIKQALDQHFKEKSQHLHLENKHMKAKLYKSGTYTWS
jgi:hypothetical protein